MKKILICTLLLGCIYLPVNAFVVAAPGVEGRLDDMQIYNVQKDWRQEQREIKKC